MSTTDFDYLTELAKKQIWSSPKQDNQVIVTPSLLTARHGSLIDFRLHWRTIPLPDAIHRWHIYQIGGTHPVAFRLFARSYEWVRISDTLEAKEMFADLYTLTGYHLPLFDSYYSWTADGNLILAIKANQGKIPVNLEKDIVSFRVYSPSYFQTEDGIKLTDKIKTIGKLVETDADKASLKAFWDQYKAKKGHVFLYVNGVKLLSWPNSIETNSAVEMIFDASVKQVKHLDIKKLEVFESDLDKKLKYLVHYKGDDPGCIDYQDDIDFYVYSKEEGLYYNKNNEDAARNLTHRDYSVVTTYIKRYAESFDGKRADGKTLDPLGMQLELCIRHSGWKRALVYESSLIHELYKLKDEDVVRAMSGIDAVVPMWHAAALEKSAYCKVMRAECCSITPELAIAAWGYHAAVKYTADTPTVPINSNGKKAIPVPFRLRYGAGAYEYDDNGLLLGVYTHWVGKEYICQNTNCALVELIAGWPSTSLDEKENIRQMDLNPVFDYRVYAKDSAGYIQDVTNTDKVSIDKTRYEWTGPLTLKPIIRSNKRHLLRTHELYLNSGILSVPITQIKTDSSGSKEELLNIPMAQIDVYLNGRSLIENLDYYVKDSKVYIVNKKFLARPINTSKQKVVIRYAGHCSEDLQRVLASDRGYIEHGLMSNNSRFDLRDDRVLRVVINGQLVTKDALPFGEDTATMSPTNPFNGLPYMVQDVLAPVQTLSSQTTHKLYKAMLATNKAASDYLTLKLPQPTRPLPSAIAHKWPLYSPFITSLMMDLKYGRLVVPDSPTYTRQFMIDTLKRYEWLLQLDPAYQEQDDRYVVVHPHPWDRVMQMPSSHMRFISKANDMYLKSKVVLSGFIQTSP